MLFNVAHYLVKRTVKDYKDSFILIFVLPHFLSHEQRKFELKLDFFINFLIQGNILFFGDFLFYEIGVQLILCQKKCHEFSGHLYLSYDISDCGCC